MQFQPAITFTNSSGILRLISASTLNRLTKLRPNIGVGFCALLLLLLMLCWCVSVSAQPSVSLEKRASRIPKSCEGLVPAAIADPVDIPGLLKEAYCKGSGDMLAEYSYSMISAGRSMDKKGQLKEESTTYEVFIPTLKSGTRGKGVMVATHRNGVPVPDGELEKARLEAGKRLEKAEAKNASEKPSAPETAADVRGMLPVGMYTSTTNTHRSTFGKSTSTKLGVHTFLKTCELTLARREHHDGREVLIFNFAPRPDAQFADDEKYIAQLTGEMWIDGQDRIVTRLIGRPGLSANNAARPATNADPPAVYVEMMRLPEGVWLPRIVRINGLDYNQLFDGLTWDSTWTFSDFHRFATEVKDVKVNPE